ncbi:MAG: LamG domain-containing protein [Planctomycetota bacterium]|nr:LamG domain-containing protein [Planctomycetota bacterium]
MLALAASTLLGCSDLLDSGSDSSGSATGEYGFSVNDNSSYEVSGPWGGPFPQGQREFVLTNTSKYSVIDWALDGEVPWLIFSTSEGQLHPGDTAKVVVQINQSVAALLSVGRYPLDVVFRDLRNDQGEIYLAFALNVRPTPGGSGLVASPEDGFDLTFDLDAGIASSDLPLQLSNIASNPISWSATTSDDWLQLNQLAAGQLGPATTSTLPISIDGVALAALGEGNHSAWVTLQEEAPLANPLPVEVRVTLTQGSSEGRVSAGLLALWDFEDASNPSYVADVSGVSPALDLMVEDPGNTLWVPGVLSLNQPTRLSSDGAATKLTSTLMGTGELTLEAWITPANVTQNGPARIMTLSGGASTRDFTLGQGLWGSAATDSYNTRLRTTVTDLNGMPLIDTGGGVAKAKLQHVVYTRSADGTAKLWIDGQLELLTASPGMLQNWDTSFQFALGNEIGTSRPWLGGFHLAAIYDRALTDGEVQQNFGVGPGDADVGIIRVDPASNFVLSGQEGSDFEGITKTYTVTNPGTDTVAWAAFSSDSWTTLSGSTQGVLNPGQSSQVVVALDPLQAAAFTAGSYQAEVDFTNDTNGYGSTQRLVLVNISPPGGGGGSGDKPGPNNTGPSDESLLVPSGGMNITVDGTLIENVDISGSVKINANNVTIRNFRIDGGGGSLYGIQLMPGTSGTLIEDGEIIEISSAGIYGGGFTARRLNIHESGHDAIKSRSNSLVESCWLHHVGLTPGAHADGNQTRVGSNITFRGNFFDMPIDIGGGYKSNSNSINQAELGDVTNLVMDGNWFNGGNYTVYFAAKGKYGDYKVTNCQLINNRFGRDYRFNTLRVVGEVTNLLVDGNVWDDTGDWMDINDDY